MIVQNAAQQLCILNRSLASLTRATCFSDALQLFAQIHASPNNLRPDDYTLSSAITACANLRDAVSGTQVHALAVSSGLRAYPYIGNNLLSLYAKVEDLVAVKKAFTEIQDPDAYSWTSLLSACAKLSPIGNAVQVFNVMPRKNVASWNALITGCAESGDAESAFTLFSEMHRSGVKHDKYTFASVLSLCSLAVPDHGKQVQSLVIKTGFLARPSVINAQLTMYFNCGNVFEACTVFENSEPAMRDHITFSAMITGLGGAGREKEALVVFKSMQEACLKPSERTFVSLMSLCSSEVVGPLLHGLAIKMGYDGCTSVYNAAMTMYSGMGDLNAAHQIFNELLVRDIVSWNTIIMSYAQGNHHELAISTYLQMQRQGIAVDEFTIGSLLASSVAAGFGEMVLGFVFKNGLILNIQVSNVLVSAFSKHGEIKQAYQIFSDMP